MRMPEKTEDQIQDDQMEDEIIEVKKWLKKYTSNIDTLLLDHRPKEVKKAMINYLVEQL